MVPAPPGPRDGSADFAERRRAVLSDGSLRGLTLARAYADLVDGWLAQLLGGEQGVALVAVGGYGRRQLFPGSDLDLVLVHRGRRDVARVAERLWYPVWDAHLALDHSVRTVKEALAVARGDLKAALGLIDARLVAGDPELAGDLIARSRRQWRDLARRWLPELDHLCRQRHAQEGDVAFLLEPDLKEAKGGLRDASVLGAMALAAPILPEDDLAVGPAAGVLAEARAELHRQTGRPSDRLLLQEQDGVAAALGLQDADDLMAGVAAAARTLSWAGDDAWRRVRSWLAGPGGRLVSADRPLGPGLVLRDGEVDLEGAVLDATLVLRAAEAAARHQSSLSRAAIASLRLAPPPARPWPSEARRALVSLLGAGRAAVPVIEDLDQHGLLTRLLPEWEAVRNKPQRNAYHRYTVDRHLLEAAAEAAALVRRVGRPDLLLVGAWLHDLGKGWPGDHTEAGIRLLAELGPALGFPPEDVEVLVNLVRHHLLLADAATRRDLSDPSTIDAVAAAVGDRPTLDLLAALTEADSRATGESAWTTWKQALVADLVARVGRALEGHRQAPRDTFPAPRHRELVQAAAGGWLVVGEGDRLTVVAPDRPGLFAMVTGVLALQGLGVLAADAWSGDGVAVSEHVVSPELGGPPDWDALKATMASMDGRPEALEAALTRRARTYARRRTRAGPDPPPRVLVDLEASDSATVVEVCAPDQVGLLHRVTRALAGQGLDIRHAKVLTLGHDVVDTFYLLDSGGHKVTDAAALAALREAVLCALGGTYNPLGGDA